jgi:hypothetical protein
MSNERDELVNTLGALFFDRGNVVPDWPDDERDLYREVSARSFTEARKAVEELRLQKAADAILSAGYRKEAGK